MKKQLEMKEVIVDSRLEAQQFITFIEKYYRKRGTYINLISTNLHRLINVKSYPTYFMIDTGRSYWNVNISKGRNAMSIKDFKNYLLIKDL